MFSNGQAIDYEPVVRSRRGGAHSRQAESEEWSAIDSPGEVNEFKARRAQPPPSPPRSSETEIKALKIKTGGLKRGHALTFVGLFLFTIVLYLRPAELYPSPFTNSIAYFIGIATLAVFAATQFTLEGTLTARPREVNLVLLFCLTGLLSIPLASDRPTAWSEFTSPFIRCVAVFIVLVNAVRTERRLKLLLILALLVSCALSFSALSAFRAGELTVEGYRAAGRGGGIFGNSNDMALHLVTIVPIAAALFFGARGIAAKIFYGACAALMVAAIVVTYSRGGFLGLVFASGVLAWKLGRRNRLGVIAISVFLLIALLVLAPGGYGLRVISIFIPSLDPVGSSAARQGDLLRSLHVALFNPVFGVGMGNYRLLSYHGLVSHNSYTQVASEMGVAATIIYTLFVVTPIKRLWQIERETFDERKKSRYFYLAVGLQASLVGYMVSSLFASVAYLWYVYYLVGYAVCLRLIYEAKTGVRVEAKEEKKQKGRNRIASPASAPGDEGTMARA